MGRTDYSKMSAENKAEDVTEQLTNKVQEEIENTPEEVTVSTDVTGRVINCGRLNIRDSESLDANILCTVDVGSIVMIVSETLPNEWFKVVTESGIEGFCMSKYILIEQ